MPAISMAQFGCAMAAAPVLPVLVAVPEEVPVDEELFVALVSSLPVVSRGFTPVEVEALDPVLLDLRAMAGSAPLVAVAVKVFEGFFVPVLLDLSAMAGSAPFVAVAVAVEIPLLVPVGLPDLLAAVVLAGETSPKRCAALLEGLLSV